MPFSRLCLLVTFTLLAGKTGFAEQRSLVILHTNDLHDHVRPDYDGRGGLAYVAGYIGRVRAQRDDVLVLDAGDVMEKGDLAVFRDKSRVMYTAMGEIGFDAAAPGNHDDAYGDAHLLACAQAAAPMRVLAVNMLKPDGSLLFPASHVFERNGVRIGVIGVFRPRESLSLDLEATAEAVALEAKRLEPDVHLIVVVAHLGPKDCATIANRARNVDVFVSGHTHQALTSPQQLEPTNALVVQAGSYAEYVGRLELTMDTETEEIVHHEGKLIAMDHDDVRPDEALAAVFDEIEERLAPRARELVVTTEAPVGYEAMALLGAEGVRRLAGADIGFCHPSQIIRAQLPAGRVDVNAVFRTGGQRGYNFVSAELSGRVIAIYVGGLAETDWGKTAWSGFRAQYRPDGLAHDLDPEQTYRVVMPLKEWDTRFERYFERERTQEIVPPTPIEPSFTDGVVALLREHPDGPSPEELAGFIAQNSSFDP